MPDQFITLIRVAKKKGSPYSVKELTHDDFINVKQLMADTGTNFNVNSNGEPVLLNKIRVVKVEKKKPFLFFYKTSYAESYDNWKTVDVRHVQQKKNTRASGSAINSSETLPSLQKAYKTKLSINENKKKDLRFLLEKNYIPKYYHNFYQSLF